MQRPVVWGCRFSAFWAPFLRATKCSSSWAVLFIVAQLPKGSLYFWEARVRPWGPWKKPTSTFQSLGVSFFSFLGFIFVSQKCVAKLGGSSHSGATPQRAPRFLGSLNAALRAFEKGQLRNRPRSKVLISYLRFSSLFFKMKISKISRATLKVQL